MFEFRIVIIWIVEPCVGRSQPYSRPLHEFFTRLMVPGARRRDCGYTNHRVRERKRCESIRCAVPDVLLHRSRSCVCPRVMDSGLHDCEEPRSFLSKNHDVLHEELFRLDKPKRQIRRRCGTNKHLTALPSSGEEHHPLIPVEPIPRLVYLSCLVGPFVEDSRHKPLKKGITPFDHLPRSLSKVGDHQSAFREWRFV